MPCGTNSCGNVDPCGKVITCCGKVDTGCCGAANPGCCGNAEIAGKVALVTGAARGIGKAMCEALLCERLKVCMADVLECEGRKTLCELAQKYGGENVIFQKLDVVDQKAFDDVAIRTKQYFGHLDVICNNAGVIAEANPKRTIDINLIGVSNGIHTGVKHLVNSCNIKGGTVINTASILGIETVFFLPTYTATKHAVNALTRTWGHPKNVAVTNVKVSSVCPEPVDTALWSGLLPIHQHTDFGKKVVENMKPNLLNPQDIAQAVVKLLKDDCSGAALVVSKCKGAYYHQFLGEDYTEGLGK